jgi:hypothetical protein
MEYKAHHNTLCTEWKLLTDFAALTTETTQTQANLLAKEFILPHGVMEAIQDTLPAQPHTLVTATAHPTPNLCTLALSKVRYLKSEKRAQPKRAEWHHF